MEDFLQIAKSTPASITKLQTLLGIGSPNELYNLIEKEAIPDIRNNNPQEYSYALCIKSYVAYLKTIKDTRDKAKEQATQDKDEERRSKMGNKFGAFSEDTSSEIAELTITKMKVDIRRGNADAERILQDNAIKKGAYLDKAELTGVVEPFLMDIRNLLLKVAHEFPETQKQIDEGMENLYDMGRVMLQDVKIDSEAYVEHLLNRDISEYG